MCLPATGQKKKATWWERPGEKGGLCSDDKML